MMRSMSARIMTLVASVAVVVFGLGLVADPLWGGGVAEAKSKKKPARYHFALSEVTSTAEGADKALVDTVIPVLTAEVQKAFGASAQVVGALDGAPDPAADPKGYAKYLKKKKIAGSYRVNVEITMYAEELEDASTGNGDKRLVVRLELRMFGETIPERKMGFVGEGSSTIKQDVGKKARAKDREFALQSAVELAVADAMAESLAKLSAPPPKPAKKSKSKK